MKCLSIAMILIIPMIFANQYGPATMSLEKTWIVSGLPETRIELNGIFIVNNTYQKVKSVELSQGAYLIYENQETIKVGYNGTLNESKQEISAKAVVDVLYEPNLPNDISFEIQNLPAEGYIAYDAEIEDKARGLSDESSAYGTVKELTEWTNKHITYDLSYFGANIPAKQTFVERKGVCVEYSHLLISMFRSLGFETRYVSGYVYSKEWQPHAWVEVLVGEVWIPLDPTFGEAEYLDNSHIMMYRGKDQNDIVDRINSNKKLEFETKEEVEVISSTKSDSKLLDITYEYNQNSEEITVSIKNRKNEPIFFSYDIAIPKDAGNGERMILLLGPKETIKKVYSINPGYVQEGFVYNVPIMALINDLEYRYDLVISKEKKENTEKNCALSFAVILLASALSIVRR